MKFVIDSAQIAQINLYVIIFVEFRIQPNRMRKPVCHENKKKPRTVVALGFSLELLPRFELGTSSLPRMRSTD